MTQQTPEKLLYKGEECRMTTEPLGDVLSESEFERLAEYSSCTGCYRGYVGSWEIDDNKLYLVDLSPGFLFNPNCRLFLTGLAEYLDKENTDLNCVFPSQKRVFASWFTGRIWADAGKLLVYGRKYGMRGMYEKNIRLKLENGVVVHEEEIDNNTEELSKQREVAIFKNKVDTSEVIVSLKICAAIRKAKNDNEAMETLEETLELINKASEKDWWERRDDIRYSLHED